ncbi:MAG: hypothetical protein ACT4OE_08250 [Sphingosinicella sp.]
MSVENMQRGIQRVRIGLTGLAFVFLAVLLAMVFTRQPASEEAITPNMLERQQASGGPVGAEAETPTEPLAEMGVAPGNPAAGNEAEAAQPPAQSAPR